MACSSPIPCHTLGTLTSEGSVRMTTGIGSGSSNCGSWGSTGAISSTFRSLDFEKRALRSLIHMGALPLLTHEVAHVVTTVFLVAVLTKCSTSLIISGFGWFSTFHTYFIKAYRQSKGLCKFVVGSHSDNFCGKSFQFLSGF